MVVTEIHGSESVEGASQEFGRILVPVNQIVALAFQ